MLVEYEALDNNLQLEIIGPWRPFQLTYLAKGMNWATSLLKY